MLLLIEMFMMEKYYFKLKESAFFSDKIWMRDQKSGSIIAKVLETFRKFSQSYFHPLYGIILESLSIVFGSGLCMTPST